MAVSERFRAPPLISKSVDALTVVRLVDENDASDRSPIGSRPGGRLPIVTAILRLVPFPPADPEFEWMIN